jgi:O-methyltransferase
MNYTIEPWADKQLEQGFLDILQKQSATDLNLIGKFDIKSRAPWERYYILWNGLEATKNLPGNFVQCGVYMGDQAYFMADVSDKTVYLFDSFEGAENLGEFDNEYYVENPYKCSVEDCAKNLAEFDNVSINVGRVPANFEKVEQISLLYVDVNLYEPTKISLDQLWSKIVDNGILMVDTHDNYSTGATKAVTEFAAAIGKEIQMLPTGIAVITK